MPHTHNDAGWLKTVDEYFEGPAKGNDYANVRMIIDSVIPELIKDKRRKFTYVEMKYFSMWYNS